MKTHIVITYTTQYREGRDRFRRVAETLAAEKEGEGVHVMCGAVDSKQALHALLLSIREQGQAIAEFHFVGHGGMYGPMWGTTAFPEQFSPYELRTLDFPWAPLAQAYFHCCRSARWFAPYFAQVQGVTTHGYHWYTTFSSRKDRYRLPGKVQKDKPLYTFGAPGRTSHGWGATFRKLMGRTLAEPWSVFEPKATQEDTSYNEVAALYAATFADITVRRDEIKWIKQHLPQQPGLRMLDIGCGSGSLLKAMADRIGHGIGVDVSAGLLAQAEDVSETYPHIQFAQVEGPELPLEDNSVDVAVSLLSFRYLDWDPMMEELSRVLGPQGRLLVVDMVTAPVRPVEWPRLLMGKLRHYQDRRRRPEFYRNLRTLVKHPGWAQMLRYNPIRSQREMQTYLESRFPGQKAQIINVGLHSRILAFDSGPMSHYRPAKLSYP